MCVYLVYVGYFWLATCRTCAFAFQSQFHSGLRFTDLKSINILHQVLLVCCVTVFGVSILQPCAFEKYFPKIEGTNNCTFDLFGNCEQ